MPTTLQRPELSVSLVAVPEASAAIIYSLFEIFSSVGTTWQQITGQVYKGRRISPRIVAATVGIEPASPGLSVCATNSFDEKHRSQVVIVPDLFLDPQTPPSDQWVKAIEWIKQQYSMGAVICSVCTGSILLAETGLLDGLEATTHWSAKSVFSEHHQAVQLRPEKILLPAGEGHRIITCGGSASWHELALYLIARFCSEDEARHIMKIFLLGDRGNNQLPFSAMVRPSQHDDNIIAEVQEWIALNYTLDKPVSKMIAISGLTARTFKRRFKAATGYTPIDYVQSLRIEEAKQVLETTRMPFEDVAVEVGYEDANSFRRLFKKRTGITPHLYRKQFQQIGKRFLEHPLDLKSAGEKI